MSGDVINEIIIMDILERKKLILISDAKLNAESLCMFSFMPLMQCKN